MNALSWVFIIVLYASLAFGMTWLWKKNEGLAVLIIISAALLFGIGGNPLN